MRLETLLANSSEDFARFLRAAIRMAALDDAVHFVLNGHEALRYLRREGPYANTMAHPFPGLLLLKLYMPVLDGFDVIKEIRASPGLRLLPIHVWSISPAREDTARA